MNPQRRQILIRFASAVAVAALDLPAFSANADDAPRAAGGIDVHIELHAVADQVAIRPGAPTRVWRYQAKLLRGGRTQHADWRLPGALHPGAPRPARAYRPDQ